MYLNGSIKEYLKDLASKRPAPGGGSAASLSAAIGASLMSMAANYTTGSPKYKDAAKEASDILKKAEEARARLEALIDADVEAYDALSKAIKGGVQDPKELDKVYKDAASVPFEVCKICAALLPLCKKLADIGNKNLITDTAIAAILLEGAFFSAKFNVYVNLKYVKDMGWIGCIHEAISPYEESLPKLKEDILEKCEEIIQK